MPGQSAPPPFGSVVELIVKVVGATFAGLYVVGLLVVNMSLAEYDFSAFSYARPQYVLTGLWTVLSFGGSALPVLGAARLLRRNRAAISSFAAFRANLLPGLAVLIGAALLLVVSPLLWFLGLKAAGGDTLPLFGAFAMLLCCLFSALTCAIWMVPVRGGTASIQPVAGAKQEDGRPEATVRVIFGGLATALSLLLFANVFALTGYRTFSPAYGGGRPQRARVVLEGPAIADLVRLGFPLRGGTSISLPVSILADAGDDVLVKTDTLRFRLQKGIVKAVNPKNFPADSMWERQEFYDIYRDATNVTPSPNCPNLDVAELSARLDRIVGGFGIPLHRPDLSWECGVSCYSAVHMMETAVAEAQAPCKPPAPHQP